MPIGDKNSKAALLDSEVKALAHLLSLISSPASKQQLPSLKYEVGRKDPPSSENSLPHSASAAGCWQTSEALELTSFSLKYRNERQFSNHPHCKLFQDICLALTKHRLASQEWLSQAPKENILRVLMCLRILLRDSSLKQQFFSQEGIQSLAEYFQKVTDEYLYCTDRPYSVEILKEMTNIFQKLSASVDRCEWLVECRVHRPLVHLLTATDVFVLHCSLYALIGLAQRPVPRMRISELNAVEMLLRILQEYDTISKKLAANLLRLLCADVKAREQVKFLDGVPLLLSQLHGDNVSLLWHVVWCLVLLCEDADCKKDIRQMGGIPLMLSLLHDRKFVSERTDASTNAVASAGVHRKALSHEQALRATDTGTKEDFIDQQYSLKQACCSALTELVLNDTNAQQIVQANGIYSLGLLILPQQLSTDKERKRAAKLQQNAFRALRFLFSMERNRRLFKHLFPADLYEMFIDVGHYNHNLAAYKPLSDKINSFSKEAVMEIKEKICETNQNKEPNYYIGEFAVFELLGTGAFGSVYKVRKKTGRQSFMALKELNLQNAAFGKNAVEKEKSVGEITNELKIMKEEMKHPNIVRYFKTFQLNEKLYILMELIEGAHLGEHFNSLKEKKSRFEESRIWNILIQLLLALRYLHKEKGIVHRDLTPNNVMLGENDKVTITDFGLAKQKSVGCSKMTSVVGTILYSCPEVVQSLAYNEKADIWALGCILYQMCMLEPPFLSNNMLTLVNKIVAGEYMPIPEKDYSAKLVQTIKHCLHVLPKDRPDVVELSSQLADRLLGHMDQLRISQVAMERKLDRERKRTQKHFVEADQNMQNYHRQFPASQEGYDRLTNLAGSGGAQELKEADPGDAFGDVSDSAIGHSVALSVSSIQLDGSDEDSFSGSGSESRESSAGSVRSQHLSGPGLNLRRLCAARDAARKNGTDLSVLELEIPAKTSRESSVSSGDPSPSAGFSSSPLVEPPLNGRPIFGNRYRHNIARSQSTNEVSALEKRSKSTAMVKISQTRLREIDDPILQMMQQLHKLIYITQLPPTLSPNPNRRIIELYKRALFSPQSTSLNLKSEITKLMQGSKDIIDLHLGPPEYWKRNSGADIDSPNLDSEKMTAPFYDPDYKDVGITYEYLQTILEAALEESGYYKVKQEARSKVS